MLRYTSYPNSFQTPVNFPVPVQSTLGNGHRSHEERQGTYTTNPCGASQGPSLSDPTSTSVNRLNI
jgi:hypothetical protein